MTRRRVHPNRSHPGAQEWSRRLAVRIGVSNSGTLWLYIPQGVNVVNLSFTTKGNREIPAQHQLAANLLMVGFQDQPDPVRWELSFSNAPAK
jgi:hypothetical protein